MSPQAELQMRRDNQRALKALERGLVHAAWRREPIPVGEATESSWGALQEAQAEPLRRHFEDAPL